MEIQLPVNIDEYREYLLVLMFIVRIFNIHRAPDSSTCMLSQLRLQL